MERPAPIRPIAVTPLSPERYKVQCTVSREAYETLRRAQDLLRHVIPSGDPGAIFERALSLLGGRSLSELSGLGPYFIFPYPQFLGGVNVIDSEDDSRYHALEMKLERRFADGNSYLFGYTLSRSKDTRSYDPAFTVVSTANNQSASSTPFDIFNRGLN